MIAKGFRYFREFERRGEDDVRSAIARGNYSEEEQTAAQQWLDKREQKRARQFKTENRKANIILAVATAMGAIIVSLVAIG